MAHVVNVPQEDADGRGGCCLPVHLSIPDVVQKLGQICRAPKLTSRALSLTGPSGETALSISDPNPSIHLPGHKAPCQGGTQITHTIPSAASVSSPVFQSQNNSTSTSVLQPWMKAPMLVNPCK